MAQDLPWKKIIGALTGIPLHVARDLFTGHFTQQVELEQLWQRIYL